MVRIPEDWKPKTEDELSKRAFFFLHMVGAQAMEHLESVLEESPRAAHNASTDDVLHSVKLLVCISVYLAVIEQSEEPPHDWLSDWRVEVLTQLDEMIKEPPVTSLTDMLAASDSDEIIAYATDRVCSILKLRKREFQDVLFDLVEEEHDFRNEILVISLSHSLEELQNHAALFP